MIKLIFILLALIYILWVLYRLLVNQKNHQKLPLKPIIFFILIILLAMILLPRMGLLVNKLIPLLSNPLGLFQIVFQKILPLINILRGIIPF